jgi:hypothetical protein
MSFSERITAKVPVVSMEELVYGSRSRPRSRAAEMKARIDPESLRQTRARLRRRGTRRVIKSIGRALVGPVLLLGGVTVAVATTKGRK